jgi:hypothetical protein
MSVLTTTMTASSTSEISGVPSDTATQARKGLDDPTSSLATRLPVQDAMPTMTMTETLMVTPLSVVQTTSTRNPRFTGFPGGPFPSGFANNRGGARNGKENPGLSPTAERFLVAIGAIGKYLCLNLRYGTIN